MAKMRITASIVIHEDVIAYDLYALEDRNGDLSGLGGTDPVSDDSYIGTEETLGRTIRRLIELHDVSEFIIMEHSHIQRKMRGN